MHIDTKDRYNFDLNLNYFPWGKYSPVLNKSLKFYLDTGKNAKILSEITRSNDLTQSFHAHKFVLSQTLHASY